MRRRRVASHRYSRFTPLVAFAAILALVSPAVGAIHGVDGKIAFESDRAGTGKTDVWITTTDWRAPPMAPAAPIAANLPNFNEGRPAWAPTAALTPISDVGPDGATPGSQVFFTFATGRQPQLQQGWEVVIRWPGTSVETAGVVTSSQVVRAVVPDDAQSGWPCLSIMAKAIVPGWPARRLSRFLMVGTRPVVEDTDDCGDQPLAFQSDRAGRWDIFLHDPMTGAVISATPNTANSDETAPAWSSQMGTGVDESSLRSRPLLAFASNRAGKGDIFVLDPLTADPPVNVTNTPADDEANPDWSSDGGWLTFDRERNGDRQLWAMPIDVNGTAPTAAAHQVTAGLGSSTEPSWFSWKGPFQPEPREEIAFDGPRPDADLDLHYVEAPLAPAPFGDPSVIEQWSTPEVLTREMHPAWSPQGNMLAYAADRPEDSGDAGGDFNLWVRRYMDDATDQEWLITGGAGNDVHPAWQPLYNSASVIPRRPRGRASRRKARLSVIVDPGPGPGPGSGPAPGPDPGSDRCTVKGTAGSDVLRGTPGADVICGLGGADRLIGRGGNDVLEGGGGPDRLSGGGGDDRVAGGGGRDQLSGDAGDDRLSGDAGADRLAGGPGRDRLSGGAGDDRLVGGAGRDRMIGGAGRDRAVRDRRDTVSTTERTQWP